jgi:hypothetical protein
MRWENIVGLCAVAAVLTASLAQQFMATARAAAPVVRPAYAGIGAGVNESTAVIWLLGSDGSLKFCTHRATGANTDAPVCSVAASP